MRSYAYYREACNKNEILELCGDRYTTLMNYGLTATKRQEALTRTNAMSFHKKRQLTYQHSVVHRRAVVVSRRIRI